MNLRSIGPFATGLGHPSPISRRLFAARPPRRPRLRSWRRPILASMAALLAAVGGWTVGTGLWSGAKTWLADALIARAWRSSLATGRHVKPWPWADAWPVARLRIPALGIERYVLSGAEGALGMGARHMAGTALPGEAGNSVIGALREEDFAFLRELRAQTEIDVDSMDTRGIRYTVRYVQELDTGDFWITKQEGPTRLTLITCSPRAESPSNKAPCHAVSAYAVEGERLARPALAPEQSEGPVLPQNTMFGRKTRV